MPDNNNVGFVPMGGINDLPGSSTNKKLLVLFIVDATRSMEGQAISQVNVAMQELMSELRTFGSNNGIDLKVAIMSFTNSIRWEMMPTDIQSCYDIPRIDVRPGLTQYGVIYHELNPMLVKGKLLEERGKQAAPVIILLTDGAPCDDYSYDLSELKRNGYFVSSNRAAVIMGEGANDPRAHHAVEDFVSEQSQILTTGDSASIVNRISLATMHTVKGQKLDGGSGSAVDPNGGTAPDPKGGNASDPFGGFPDPSGGNSGDTGPFGSFPDLSGSNGDATGPFGVFHDPSDGNGGATGPFGGFPDPSGGNGDATGPFGGFPDPSGGNGDATGPFGGFPDPSSGNGDATGPFGGNGGDATGPFSGNGGDATGPFSGNGGDATDPFGGNGGDATSPFGGGDSIFGI